MKLRSHLFNICTIFFVTYMYSTEQSSAEKSSLLPLGDQKFTTSTPKKGYIYLCNAHKESNAGAFSDGPWIHGQKWDPSEKISVDGSVSWPTASFSITTKGKNRNISTNALPQHTTGVFPIQPSDDAYTYDRNPNTIQAQSTISITVPKNPTIAATPTCIGGEVGLARTGVPIFNGFDAGLRDAVAHEIQDQYNGHPQEAGEYHYHNLSNAVTQLLSKGVQKNTPVLLGYAYDGFGIFEGVENGKKLTNDDLDECHGHKSRITWDGKKVSMYHYHATAEFPYTVGCFKGTPVLKGPTSNNRNGTEQQSQQGVNTQNRLSPPTEAFSACEHLQSTNTCSFIDEHGSHSGTCTSPPNSTRLVCVP